MEPKKNRIFQIWLWLCSDDGSVCGGLFNGASVCFPQHMSGDFCSPNFKVKEFRWQICFVCELFDSEFVCKCELIFFPTKLKVHWIISQQSRTWSFLKSERKVADKLLNAFRAAYQIVWRNCVARNTTSTRAVINYHTFNWIVGQFCWRSCRWDICRLLHIRFCKKRRKIRLTRFFFVWK